MILVLLCSKINDHFHKMDRPMPRPASIAPSTLSTGMTSSGHGSQSGRLSTTLRPRPCRTCGQHHSHHEPHLYNYKDEVDEDLMCQICLQPFVAPLDTPCGHTFCQVCMNNYLKVNPMCPLDRKPLTDMSCSPSNLVLKRLLDKLPVTCPNSDSCDELLQRGLLSDHLRYRCSGTMVACQFAGAGCDFRGPTKKMTAHQIECRFKKEGITRLPVLEGEVSHVEIPRTSSSLGITIVGGADTPLRCVVVQEVYPDGLIAMDGRLQPGDQIIEINGVDMTCAPHSQVCTALRKMTSVLRLGVYRERIEKYGGRMTNSVNEPSTPTTISPQDVQQKGFAVNPPLSNDRSKDSEELLTVTLERQPGRQLGIRLSGGSSAEPGIFISDIQDGSSTASDGRLQIRDRILFINGQDVRNSDLSQASALIQNNDKVSLVVARKKSSLKSLSQPIKDCCDEVDGQVHALPAISDGNGFTISHVRSKSAPAIHHKNGISARTSGLDDHTEDEDDSDDESDASEARRNIQHRFKQRLNSQSSSSNAKSEMDHVYDVPEGGVNEDYMAIYETIDRKRQEAREMKGKSHSMEALETPEPSLKSFDANICEENGATGEESISGRRRHRSKPHSSSRHSIKENRRSLHETTNRQGQSNSTSNGTATKSVKNSQQLKSAGIENARPDTGRDVTDGSMTSFLKRALRMEGPQLIERTVHIKKTARESLGMRIGGGIGSNEGDTPIYVANIHPHGCIGKSKQLKKGDLLLSVDGTSLCGLTHSQAVATLKATINLDQVVLGVMDGPETSYGASNFVPSWMYWQKLPRNLQYPKTVILHRRQNASWGFSIVGGADSGGSRPPEPIHVLFVVPESPAAKDAKLKCGDRLLAVDGHSLENIPHHLAVAMLKQTSTRVVMEVVSWMGTEL